MAEERLGLALGGGGGRGPAHAGVLRALDERGIEVHCLAGASAGALIGVLWALGDGGNAMLDVLDRPDQLRALYRDRLRLHERNPLGARIAALIGERHIDDLRLPVAICAADVWTHELVVFRSGPLLPSLQASIAIPFIAPAVRVGGRYVADTGRDNSGVLQAVRDLGATVVLEVVLHRFSKLAGTAPAALGTRPAIRLLGQRRADGRPSRRATVLFALDLACRRRPPVPPADVLLRPAVPLVPLFTPAGARKAYAAGYRAAREALPQLRRLLQEGAPA